MIKFNIYNLTSIKADKFHRYPASSDLHEFFTREITFTSDTNDELKISLYSPSISSLLFPGETAGDVEVKVV